MTTNKPTRNDLRPEALALVLAVATLFFGASLVSRDLADPPSTYAFPASLAVRNWCGPLGVRLANGSVDLIGVASLVPCLAGLTFSIMLVRRRPIADFLWAALGFFLLTTAGAALFPSGAGPERLVSVHGAGGAVGLLLSKSLHYAASPLSGTLLLSAVFIAGLLLAFSGPALWLGQAARRLPGSVRSGLARLRAHLAARRAARQAEREPAQPALKIFGPDDSSATTPAAVLALKSPDAVGSDLSAPALAAAAPAPREHPRQELKIVRTGFDDPLADPLGLAADSGDEPADEEAPSKSAPQAPPPPPPSAVRLPELEILDDPEPFEYGDHEQEILERARLLEKTLAQFQMAVKVVQIDTGPVVTQYEIELEAGLRARKVMAMGDDLAIAMRAPNVRIVAPIPGKNTVGIEVPNERRAKVGLKEVMLKAPATARMRLPLYLGKDVKGQPLVCDLATMPHLLIAGRTGTGKSVCLNTLILSILMTRTPDQVKMLMIDPKMVELSLYKSIPHLLHPVVTDMKKAEALLGWAVEKMEERYSLLARAGVRHIESYNKLSPAEIHQRLDMVSDEDKASIPDQLPYILIFADEMADLMMTSAKEVEQHIIRLAQKSRAVGIHLVLATQKPTVDVITGLIKSNLPARIAFQVASRSDSRVVLDEMGADKLLGNGDMLFLYPGTSKIVRAQGTFVSDEEVQRVVEHLSSQARPQYSSELIRLKTKSDKDSGDDAGQIDVRDDLYTQAVDVIVREGRGSVSLLQRALGIGYGRGARLIDFMAEDGIVGEYNGSQAREVLYTPEQWEEIKRTRIRSAESA